MTTTTLFIDSRTKISGTHADFRVSLPEQVTLRGSRMRLDSIRTTDTITTVSARNKYAYFLDGAGGLTSVELGDAAYIGSTFATQLATKSGRTCTYLSSTNSLQVAYAEGTRIIWEDEELKSFPASAFPDGATPQNPLSINDILGSTATISGSTITFHFITMAPLQDVYLCSHRLMVHESWMPKGQRNALAKLSLGGGFGTTVTSKTPDGIYYGLGDHVTLKELDFQLRDYRGATIPLLAPISFQLIFES